MRSISLYNSLPEKCPFSNNSAQGFIEIVDELLLEYITE